MKFYWIFKFIHLFHNIFWKFRKKYVNKLLDELLLYKKWCPVEHKRSTLVHSEASKEFFANKHANKLNRDFLYPCKTQCPLLKNIAIYLFCFRVYSFMHIWKIPHKWIKSFLFSVTRKHDHFVCPCVLIYMLYALKIMLGENKYEVVFLSPSIRWKLK